MNADRRAASPPTDGPGTDVLVVEPYLAGSHAAWVEGYRAHSRLDVDVLAMPGRFWKWRMHGGAVTLARRVETAPSPRVVLATDMLDLAAFLGLARRRLAGSAAVLYMHENQAAYPTAAADPGWSASRRRRAERRDEHYTFVNVSSALAADLVLWNSEHNRQSFLNRLPSFLGAFPDFRERDAVSRIAARSAVLPPGIDAAVLDEARPSARRPGPPRVIWNHRWEHDKAPEVFTAAIQAVASRGVPLGVVLLGESFARAPELGRAVERLGALVEHVGYARDRAEYARWLWWSDVVVSTARHEFFGLAVMEAVRCGCLPVLPRALSYPETVPARHHDAVLYDDFDGLVRRLAAALARPDEERRRDLAAATDRFDWRTLAPRYDEALLAAGDGAARGRVPSAAVGAASPARGRAVSPATADAEQGAVRVTSAGPRPGGGRA